MPRRHPCTIAALTVAILTTSALFLVACGDDEDPPPPAMSGNNVGENNANNGDPNNAEPNNADPNNAGPDEGDNSLPDGVDDMTITWEGFSDRPCPEDSVVTWTNFGAPFMLNWCVGCHSVNLEEGDRADATPGVDFDTIEDIRMWDARIYARAADDVEPITGMPPLGGPSAEDRFLLGEWLACGAPE